MSSAQERLVALRRKKTQCQQENAAVCAQEQKRLRDRSSDPGDSDIEHHESEEEGDRLEWTASEWEAWELKRGKQGVAGGYKNYTDLAYSTYKKAIGKQAVDMDKYQAHMTVGGGGGPFAAAAEAQDVEKFAQTLQEASDNRLKRRRKEEDAGSYITEKNRQFNMKLEREYGS